MEGLQDHVLGHILKEVPRSDQLNLLLVSRRWYQVMDQYVGLHVMLGRGGGSVPINTQMDTPEILSQVGISTCEFISFCNNPRAPLQLKRPNLLRRVHFRNYVSSATFESILDQKLTNLQTLQLDHSVLRCLEFSDIDVYLSQCEVLEVISDYGDLNGIKFRHTQPDDKAGVINMNAAFLFTKSFPGLKRVKMSLPYTSATDEVITSGLLTLLHNHASSLKSVKIELTQLDFVRRRWNPIGPKAPVQIPPSFKPVTEIDLQSINLKHLNLNFPRKSRNTLPEEKTQKMDHWKIWVGKLRFMESCSLAGPFSSVTDFNPTVARNAATLKKINLNWDLGLGSLDDPLEEVFEKTITIPVDCFLFQPCVNLTHLELTGTWDTFFVAPVPSSGVNNVNFLSRTLVCIGIKCIPLSCAVCQSLCLDFPDLKKLTLRNVSGRVGLGVQLPVVLEMMRRKQLKKFNVDIGFGAEAVIEPGLLNLTSSIEHVNALVKGYLQENGDYGRLPESGTDSDDELGEDAFIE